jgi:hypothetical protein
MRGEWGERVIDAKTAKCTVIVGMVEAAGVVPPTSPNLLMF